MAGGVAGTSRPSSALRQPGGAGRTLLFGDSPHGARGCMVSDTECRIGDSAATPRSCDKSKYTNTLKGWHAPCCVLAGTGTAGPGRRGHEHAGEHRRTRKRPSGHSRFRTGAGVLRLRGPGDIGYVASIGTFLQQYWIYGVDFFERARIVGMREHEIESIEVGMKITLAKRGTVHTVYVAKKDLEMPVVAHEHEALWGGWIELGNGWRLELPERAADTRLPLTIEARKLEAAE